MKNLFELFSIFQMFYNEIKNQFGISIWILHSDNGMSIFLIHLKNLWLLMVFFIKLHVLTHLNKMG